MTGNPDSPWRRPHTDPVALTFEVMIITDEDDFFQATVIHGRNEPADAIAWLMRDWKRGRKRLARDCFACGGPLRPGKTFPDGFACVRATRGKLRDRMPTGWLCDFCVDRPRRQTVLAIGTLFGGETLS